MIRFKNQIVWKRFKTEKNVCNELTGPSPSAICRARTKKRPTSSPAAPRPLSLSDAQGPHAGAVPPSTSRRENSGGDRSEHGSMPRDIRTICSPKLPPIYPVTAPPDSPKNPNDLRHRAAATEFGISHESAAVELAVRSAPTTPSLLFGSPRPLSSLRLFCA